MWRDLKVAIEVQSHTHWGSSHSLRVMALKDLHLKHNMPACSGFLQADRCQMTSGCEMRCTDGAQRGRSETIKGFNKKAAYIE